MDFLHHGFGLTDIALSFQRVGVGLFFAISGWHKLFNPTRHKSFVQTLQKDRVPLLRFNEWWVPGWELVAGVALMVGLATAFSAAILTIICIVACATEAREKVASYGPINRADALDDWLYLPEVLYVLMLLVNVLGGGGPYSLDAILFG